VPASAHQHVRQQDQVAGKAHGDPLSMRLHILNRSSGQGSVIVNSLQVRKNRFEPSDLLSGQRAFQGSRRAQDGIALRHLGGLHHVVFVDLGLLCLFDNVSAAHLESKRGK
jgi:hypothetical protein